tara:strand:+ start:44 stop:244 length:201 start_codon:yes stop_codon:yes gene_type:complete
MPPFPQSTGTAVGPIKVLGVSTPHNSHHPRDTIFRSGRSQKMNVIGHQNEGMEIHTKARGQLTQKH